jgi:hypothetical protein
MCQERSFCFKLPYDEVRRKAWLSAFDVVHELFQANQAILFGRRGKPGSQEVLQPIEQSFLLPTSGHDRQATLWPIVSEVFEEPAVMQTIGIGHFGALQKNTVSQTVVGFEIGSVRAAVAVDARKNEFSNHHFG